MKNENNNNKYFAYVSGKV